MLDRLASVLRLSGQDEVQPILGSLPDAASMVTLREMAQARPAARRIGKGLAISVPLGGSVWHIWILDYVPAVSELAGIMSRVQELSAGIHGLRAPVATAPALPAAGPGVLARLNARMKSTGRAKPEALARMLLDDLVEQGHAAGGAVVLWQGAKANKVWVSDQRFRKSTDEIAAVMGALRQPTDRQLAIAANAPEGEVVEAAVLARQYDAPGLAIVAPAIGASGFGILAFGSAQSDLPALAQAQQILQFSAPPRAVDAQRRRRTRQIMLGLAFLALAVYLAQPAPLVVTVTGTTMGAEVTVAALPSDAYLRKMHVRVGDQVTQGALLAEFYSPALQEAQAEELLNASIEQLNGQSALAENNYAAYQISTQRLEIAQTRLAQIAERQARLQVLAPATGRVISAMPDSLTGNYAPTGEEVAAIQTSSAMRMRLETTRMDARLIGADMRGQVYFRGLTGEAYGLRVLTPAMLRVDAQTGAEHVEALAEIDQGDTARLIVGMAGFARLEGPEAPRIVGVTRYVTEFIRVKAWTYLGLRF